MARARIYRWRRMRRSPVPSNEPGRFLAAQFSAGCTTNMSGFDFRQAQDDFAGGRPMGMTARRYYLSSGMVRVSVGSVRSDAARITAQGFGGVSLPRKAETTSGVFFRRH